MDTFDSKCVYVNVIYYPWHQSLKYILYSAAITDEVKQPKLSNSLSTAQTKCSVCWKSNIPVSEKSKNAFQLGWMIFYVLWWYWNTGDSICIGVIRWITVDGWVTRSSRVTAFIYTIAGSLQPSKSITTSGGWTGLMNEYSLQFLSQLIKMFNLTLNTIKTKGGGDIHMSGIFIMFLSTWLKWSLLIILHLYGYITH